MFAHHQTKERKELDKYTNHLNHFPGSDVLVEENLDEFLTDVVKPPRIKLEIPPLPSTTSTVATTSSTGLHWRT